MNEALLSLWTPIVGGGFRDPDYSDDRQILIEQALHFDNELWEQLVIQIKKFSIFFEVYHILRHSIANFAEKS